jgi:hypothetical protein
MPALQSPCKHALGTQTPKEIRFVDTHMVFRTDEQAPPLVSDLATNLGPGAR